MNFGCPYEEHIVLDLHVFRAQLLARSYTLDIEICNHIGSSVEGVVAIISLVLAVRSPPPCLVRMHISCMWSNSQMLSSLDAA